MHFSWEISLGNIVVALSLVVSFYVHDRKRLTTLERQMAALLGLLADYMPHKHVNGKIVYPQDALPRVREGG